MPGAPARNKKERTLIRRTQKRSGLLQLCQNQDQLCCDHTQTAINETRMSALKAEKSDGRRHNEIDERCLLPLPIIITHHTDLRIAARAMLQVNVPCQG
jgi:hypothetical protein